VALEAMSGGTPVVAYDRGGLAEYVRRADAGMLVEPNVARLVDACRGLLSSPDLWRRYSRAGVDAVRRHHSPDRYLPRIEAVYREAMLAAADRHPRRARAWWSAGNGLPSRSGPPSASSSSESPRGADALTP
jgi:hypothetical protein